MLWIFLGCATTLVGTDSADTGAIPLDAPAGCDLAVLRTAEGSAEIVIGPLAICEHPVTAWPVAFLPGSNGTATDQRVLEMRYMGDSGGASRADGWTWSVEYGGDFSLTIAWSTGVVDCYDVADELDHCTDELFLP